MEVKDSKADYSMLYIPCSYKVNRNSITHLQIFLCAGEEVCCWFIPPEGEAGINRNIPMRQVIIDLLPIMTSNAQ